MLFSKKTRASPPKSGKKVNTEKGKKRGNLKAERKPTCSSCALREKEARVFLANRGNEERPDRGKGKEALKFAISEREKKGAPWLLR